MPLVVGSVVLGDAQRDLVQFRPILGLMQFLEHVEEFNDVLFLDLDDVEVVILLVLLFHVFE